MRDLKRREDTDGWRWYTDTDKTSEWFISCTKCLDSWVPDRVKKYMKKNSEAKQNKVLQQTADIGTAIHAAIEADLKGNEPILKSFDESGEWNIEKPFANWLKMKKDYSITATHSEMTLYSEKMGVAGTADLIGTFSGKPALLDIKTGFYGIKAGPQMVAYLTMAKDLGIVGPDCGLVGLHIHRDGEVSKPVVYEHYDWVFKTFTSALELFKADHFYKLKDMDWKWLYANANSYSTKEIK